MFRFFLLIALIPALVFAQVHRPCAGSFANPSGVRVVGCPSGPCHVVRGQFARMQLDFHPSASHAGLRPEIIAHLGGGARFPYPLQPQFQNGCAALVAGGCPTTPNALHTFGFDFLVNPTYPPINVGVEMRLVNPQNNQVVVCTIVDILVAR